MLLRVEIAQRAEPAGRTTVLAQTNRQLGERELVPQTETAGLRFQIGQFEVVPLGFQEEQGRGEHARHVLAGLAGELVVDPPIPERGRAVAALDPAHPALAAVVGREHLLQVVVEEHQIVVQVGDVRARRLGRIEALVEAVHFTQSVGPTGRAHELERPSGSGA